MSDEIDPDHTEQSEDYQIPEEEKRDRRGRKIGKRALTARKNLANGRQRKLELLRKQRELKKQAAEGDGVDIIDSEEDSDSDSEDEQLVNQLLHKNVKPPKPKHKVKEPKFDDERISRVENVL